MLHNMQLIPRMEHPLTKYRRENGLTLEDIAMRLGVTKGVVSRWESKKVLPRRNSLSMIERATDGTVSVSDMVKAYSETIAAEGAEWPASVPRPEAIPREAAE